MKTSISIQIKSCEITGKKLIIEWMNGSRSGNELSMEWFLMKVGDRNVP